MPIIEISEKDLLRSVVVEPAWYRVRIDEVGEALSSKGTSTNYTVEGTILFNGDTGATSFKDKEGKEIKVTGIPTPYWNFNSLAMGFAVGFLESLNVEVKPGMRVELSAARGKEIDMFIENDTYQGRLVNRTNHKYRKPRPDVVAVG